MLNAPVPPVVLIKPLVVRFERVEIFWEVFTEKVFVESVKPVPAEYAVPAGVANVPSPRRKVVVLFGGVGTAPPTVEVIVGKSAPVAALIAVPLPFNSPFIEVPMVMAGVEVAVATLPLKPFAPTTDTVETVPPPAGVANVPSPRRKVVVLLGGVGTAPPTVEVMTGKSAPVAILGTPVPVVFFKIPVDKPANEVPLIRVTVAAFVIFAAPVKAGEV